MSFASEVKKEIVMNEISSCCQKARLCGFVQMFGRLSLLENDLGILMVSENASVVKSFKILFKEVLGLSSRQTMFRKTKLRKNSVYENLISENPFEVYEKLGLYSKNRGFLDNPNYQIIQKDCCAKAYIGALFLARGSISKPESNNYHLEISLDKETNADFIIKLLKRFNIEAKQCKRRKQFVVYVKKAEQISDFLKLLGASNTLYKFEEVRVQRDYFYNVNRMMNCDTYNYQKTLKSAKKSLSEIEKILENNKLDNLDPKISSIIEVRMKYPDANLKDLVEIYNASNAKKISKSGLVHRLNKIKEIANKYEK